MKKYIELMPLGDVISNFTGNAQRVFPRYQRETKIIHIQNTEDRWLLTLKSLDSSLGCREIWCKIPKAFWCTCIFPIVQRMFKEIKVLLVHSDSDKNTDGIVYGQT